MNFEHIFLLALFAVVVIVLYLAYVVTDRKVARMVMVTPIVLALCVSMFFTVRQIQAMPIEGKPIGEFQMLNHVTDGQTIFLWAVPVGLEYPKTYKFPYTDEDAKELQKGKEKQKKGVPVYMKVKDGSQKDGGTMTIIGSPTSLEQDRTSRKDYES